MKFKAILFSLILVLFIGVLGVGNAVKAAESEQRSQFVTPILVVNTSFLNVRTGPGAQYTVLLTVVGGTELPVIGVFKDQVWYQVSTVAGVGWVNVEFTLPRGDFTNVPLAAAPEVESVDFVVLPDGTVVSDRNEETVTGVRFGGNREWGVSVVAAHPSRAQPTMNSLSPGTVVENFNAIYTLIESSSGDGIVWYRVRVPDFGLVWVEGPKTQLRPFGCTFYVASMKSTVYPAVGPDGSGTLDGNLPLSEGAEAYIIDQTPTLFKIELIDGNTGWIPRDAVVLREPGSLPSAFCDTGPARSVEDFADLVDASGRPVVSRAALVRTARVVINTGVLNIRSGPGAQYTAITTVPGGTELAVVGFAPDRVWYLVEGSFGQGWVNSEFTLFRGDASNIPIVRDFVGASLTTPTATITNAVTIYAAPDTTLGVLGAISGPIDVPVVARTSSGEWIQIRTDIGFGWVRTNQVTVGGDIQLAPVVGN